MPITWQNINAPQLDTSYITNAANLMNKGMNQGQQLVEGEINERQDTALQNLRQQASQDPSLNQEGLNSLIGSSGLDAKRQQQALDFGSKLIRQNTNDDRKLVEQGQADRKFADSLALFKQQTDLRNIGLESAALDVTNKKATRDDYLKKKADEHIVETVKNDFVGMASDTDDQVFGRMKQLIQQYPHLEAQIKKTFDAEMVTRKELSPTLAKHRSESSAAIQQLTDERKAPLIAEAAQTKKYFDESPYTAADKMLDNSSLSKILNSKYSGDGWHFFSGYSGVGDDIHQVMRDKATDPDIIADIQGRLRDTLKESSKLTPKQIEEEVANYKTIPNAVLIASLDLMPQDREKKIVKTDGMGKIIADTALDYFSYKTRSAQAPMRARAIAKSISDLDNMAKRSKDDVERQIRAQQSGLLKLANIQ